MRERMLHHPIGRLFIVAFLMLAIFLAASPAMAKKHDKKKKNRKYCPPVELGGGSLPCYHLHPRGPHGRCEPQSLPYARCRTGIMRCQGNCETSPIAWFRCEQGHGKTSCTPPPGESVLILGDNANHGMRTGHVAVVEQARDLGHGHWELTLSHTNYNRMCAIETDVQANYDEYSGLVAMKTGHWSAWGRDLKALGFIVK